MTPKEQARLQVLNNLMAKHMTLDQAAILIGVSTRHTRRLLAACPKKEAAVGLRPPGPQSAQYHSRGRFGRGSSSGWHEVPGANHTHLSELLSERGSIDIGKTTLRPILVNPESTSRSAQNPVGICGIVICPCTVPQMVCHQCEKFGRGRSSSGNCGKTLPAN